jgi:MFS family permease
VTTLLRSAASLLSIADFRRLVAGQFAAQAADGVAQAVFADILVLEPTSQGTPGKILALFAVTLVPYSVLAPFLGVFVDRWDRRKLMVGANVVRAALLLSLPLWARALPGDAPLFVAVLALQGFGRLFLATKGAVLPVVLQEHRLLQANSLSGGGGTLSAVIGGALGLLIGRISTTMEHPHPPRGRFGSALADIARDLLDGLRVIGRSAAARIPLGAIFVLRSVGIVIAIVVILLIKSEFATHEGGFGRLGLSGVALGAAGAGALVAAMSASAVGRRLGGRIRVMIAGYLVVALPLLALGAVPGVPALLGLTFMTGAGGFYCKVAVDAQVQHALHDDYRGRAFSLYDIIYNLASVAAGVAVVTFDGMGLRALLPATGAATLLMAGILTLRLRRAGLLERSVPR